MSDSLRDLSTPRVIDGERVLEPDELLDRARSIAAGLGGLGASPGDPVAFELPNIWEGVALFHACWQGGFTALPLHPRGGAARRGAVLERARPAVVLSAARDHPDGAIHVGGPGDPITTLVGMGDVLQQPADPEVAVLLATSGSTGTPKLVRHGHGGLRHKAETMAGAHGLASDDVVLMPAPLAHISGLLNGVLLPGAAGMTTVLMGRWDADSALDLIEQHGVTFMIGPPTFFVDLWNTPSFSPTRVASLRLVSSGGAGVTPGFVDRARDRLGADVKRTYGSTEAPTVTTGHVGDDPARTRATDGRPTAGVELRIADPATSTDLPDGEVGEIVVRGPELFLGYDDPEATASALRDGWFHTGDLGRLEDGWLIVVGRADDTIIRGGENIAPAEVEAACATLPGVRLAVVVGVPDQRLGQRVALVVEADARPALADVTTACESHGVARFATPEVVVAVDAVPRLDAGKPDRRAVAALAAAAAD